MEKAIIQPPEEGAKIVLKIENFKMQIAIFFQSLSLLFNFYFEFCTLHSEIVICGTGETIDTLRT
jgi:hypothetical protein